MITVTIEKTYGASGATTVRAKISAPTIERAVELAGQDARIVFPVGGEEFFAAQKGYPVGKEGIDYDAMTHEEVEEAYETGLPGAYDAWLERLKDDLGDEEFEIYAFQNALV